MRVKCLAQEHNTMSRTARSGVERTKHEATAHMKRSGKLVFSLRGVNPGFKLSKYFLECTQRNINKQNALISVFRLDLRRSLESGLIALASFLNSGW